MGDSLICHQFVDPNYLNWLLMNVDHEREFSTAFGRLELDLQNNILENCSIHFVFFFYKILEF